MRIIVKNGQVVAIHTDDQDVLSLYPGSAEIIAPDGTKVHGTDGHFLPLAEINLGDPWPQIRGQRDRLLAACDWTQLSDSPLDEDMKAAWAAYRQGLRDIPQTQAGAAGYLEIVWPDRPGM